MDKIKDLLRKANVNSGAANFERGLAKVRTYDGVLRFVWLSRRCATTCSTVLQQCAARVGQHALLSPTRVTHAPQTLFFVRCAFVSRLAAAD